MLTKCKYEAFGSKMPCIQFCILSFTIIIKTCKSPKVYIRGLERYGKDGKSILQVSDTGTSSIGQYWNIFGVPVLFNLVYLHGLGQACIILKLAILEQRYGPV